MTKPLWKAPDWRVLPDASSRPGPIQRSGFMDAEYRTRTEYGTFCRWGDKLVALAIQLHVPTVGHIRYSIEHGPGDATVGFDLEPNAGWIMLEDRSRLKALRVWDDRQYEPSEEYGFSSSSQSLFVWNVYRTPLPHGQFREEKWTENAGMLVDAVSEDTIRLHCSPGFSKSPDFENLVFSITVRPA